MFTCAGKGCMRRRRFAKNKSDRYLMHPSPGKMEKLRGLCSHTEWHDENGGIINSGD